VILSNFFPKFSKNVKISAMAKLNTSTPSGFPEFSPAQQRVIQNWKKTIAQIFESHGFPMLETPLVERAENFEAKGGNPKEIYVLDRMRREESEDQDKDSRAIRFDHTVPLAMYVARHFNDIAFPFRRSVIGPVMRGERAQRGRFRQFDQCDIDVIGSESLSLVNDAQMVAIIAEIFEKLMPEQEFVIRINNRKILIGFLKFKNVPESKIKRVLDWVDGLEKQQQAVPGRKLAFAKMVDPDFNLDTTDVAEIMNFLNLAGDPEEMFEQLAQTSENPEFLAGVAELREVVAHLRALGVPEKNWKIDLRIARGLDYYTGTVYETNLVGYEALGSVCSGGRYDDLAGIFLPGKNLPGVGISIGLTRLLWQLFDAGLVPTDRAGSTDAIVLFRYPELQPQALALGAKLRASGIAVEVYSEPKKLQKQFDFVKKMGIPCRVIVGEQDTVVECDDAKLKKSVEQKI